MMNLFLSTHSYRLGSRGSTACVFLAVVGLVGCTGEQQPFEEAIEADENNIARLEVVALDGVITPVFVGVGERLRFDATAFNGAGVASDFDTDDRRWTVSNSSVASIDSNGLLTGIADGVVEVGLNFGSLRAVPLAINVSSAALVEIVSIEGSQTPEPCLISEYTAIGFFEDNSERTLSDVSWSRNPQDSSELISEAGDSLGRIRLIGTQPGAEITLTATSLGLPFSQMVTVDTNITALSLPTGVRAVDEGSTIQLEATGTFTRAGSAAIEDVSNSVAWSVTDGTGSATITNGALDRGALTGVSAGTVNVEVACGGLRSPIQIVNILTDDDDDELSFSGDDPLTISLGTSTQLEVSTGSEFDEDDDVSDEVSWSSQDTSIATVSSDGLVTGVALGMTTITVILDGESEVLTVNVI